MELKSVVSKRLFWSVTILCIIISACLCGLVYWGMANSSDLITKMPDQDKLNSLVAWASKNTYTIVMPVIIAFTLLIGWKIWLVLYLGVSSPLVQYQKTIDEKISQPKKKKDFIDQKIEQDRKRRLFLHTLSVFQREGRLLDFFDEDLNEYDDEQIGAAVRSIQEDCKKVVKKYINPKPVLDSEEGEKVVVDPGFDIDAIKLVGNVSGDPPFEGTLNHRGWKAGKKEIPKLSDIQDSTIIIPAEVEIH